MIKLSIQSNVATTDINKNDSESIIDFFISLELNYIRFELHKSIFIFDIKSWQKGYLDMYRAIKRWSRIAGYRLICEAFWGLIWSPEIFVITTLTLESTINWTYPYLKVQIFSHFLSLWLSSLVCSPVWGVSSATHFSQVLQSIQLQSENIKKHDLFVKGTSKLWCWVKDIWAQN